MTERGMIFNGEMVRAILDGRKTQTRRIMKPQPEPCPRGGHWWPSNVFKTMLHVEEEMQNGEGGWGGLVGDACPFGDVGDRIWVREAYRFPASLDDVSPTGVGEMAVATGYRKPWAPTFYEFTGTFSDGWKGFETPPKVSDAGKLRPSIHMPRWASRILLEITDVRVERLNAISEEDARAEGIIDGGCLNCGEPEPCGCANPEPDATDAFAYLWQSIYGQESWNANPWVWVISFKRVESGAA
ncbi:hypothetical protein [Klebsiella variicola]|uniref:hypothetical protein n=1 Tax=Klebsiella variicola TaxID=244366 RepID=UPI000C7D5BEF|nr:hypothetical protein [Klebsiella variicola]PLK37119.1 hypothetical protein CYD38_00090 [Klebsiella variicola]REI43030.1 hypothetical protein DYB09_25190 [Klebsiella variicola]REI50968.1 hypothetical protein DY002_08855 [Klebsiella variicola]REI54767.1 hypothetical protein DYB19_13480 [Klebsiella variicola]REI65648.1 hypothetical protein DYZ99_22865 [Klebsiella variicola]